MRHRAFPGELSREAILDLYRAGRERSRQLFGIARPECYYDRPIPLRNPIVFYEGHLPAFAVNTLAKLTLGRRGIDERLEVLFARGIDPEDEAAAGTAAAWPSRDQVQEYVAAADALVLELLASPEVGEEAVFTVIEHELMHQETLLYMFHEMPYDKKVPIHGSVVGQDVQPPRGQITIPAGRARLGGEAAVFGWDNEFPQHVVAVPQFTIDAHNVTNADYLEYLAATGAKPPHFWERRDGQWFWRGMFEPVPLPLSWPVYVTHDQATAYARWRGMRLPTEAEYHRAAFGTPSGEERHFPWGDEPAGPARGNFDFRSFEPLPAGSHPAGTSAWGVHDLAGNGWEWTSTPFAGFEGFAAMRSYPQYSVDFFDGKHFVMKGGSPATSRLLIRDSFRNWFRPAYPYVYATFRCVRR